MLNDHLDIEQQVWISADPKDLWLLDKLILAKNLGYLCGPCGVDVPRPDWYIVRPAINAFGLGLGAKRIWIERSTDHLTVGHFWCEFFVGDHLSVDYIAGEQVLCAKGTRPEDDFQKWTKWEAVDRQVPFPAVLEGVSRKYEVINCEFIGGKLIEVHLRRNPDFDFGNTEMIPVWHGMGKNPPAGYRYVDYPEMNGRIGAFVR